MKKYFYTLVMFLTFGSLSQTFSQTDATLKTLQGFDTLKVEIEQLAPDLEKAGLKMEEIQTDVETKLRQAGFKIRNSGEANNPYVVLRIGVSSIDNGVGGFAVSITSSLNQLIILERNKSVASVASTWESRSIVSVIKEKVQAIRSFVNGQIDLFVNAHRRANSSTQKQNNNPPADSNVPPTRVPTTKKGEKNAKPS